MLERDYIMRLILQFFEALEKLKEEREKGKEEATLQQDTGSMYRCYFQQSERFFYDQDVPFIMHYLGTAFPPQELLQRIEILAELFYFDASLKKSDAERNSLLKKRLNFYSIWIPTAILFHWKDGRKSGKSARRYTNRRISVENRVKIHVFSYKMYD